MGEDNMFDFKAPDIRIDKELVSSLRFDEIIGIRFFREPFAEKIEKIEFYKEGSPRVKYHIINGDKHSAYEPTEAELALWDELGTKGYDFFRQVIGGVYCPFTGDKIRNVNVGLKDHTSKEYIFKSKDGKYTTSVRANISFFDPYRVKVRNELRNWYSEGVIGLMEEYWSYKNESGVTLDTPHLTLVEDNVTNVKIWYNRNTYKKVESKKVYVSSKGRFINLPGSNRMYLDSPEIPGFESKLNKGGGAR